VQCWRTPRLLKAGIAALRKSLLPDPFKVVHVYLGQAVQGWISELCAFQHSGARHGGLLKLLSLAPTHWAKQEREKSRCAFRNTVIMQLMTVHQSLDSEK